MNNRAFWVVLIGVLLMVISLIGSASALLPPFLAPFVILIYGMLVLYMSR